MNKNFLREFVQEMKSFWTIHVSYEEPFGDSFPKWFRFNFNEIPEEHFLYGWYGWYDDIPF